MKFGIVLKYSFIIVIIICALSFSKDKGNKNGGTLYSMSSIDGTFTAYTFTRDFNFGETAIEYVKYYAQFFQTRGDTSVRYLNGDLSFSNNPLFADANKTYSDNNQLQNGVGNQKWICSGANNGSDFNYHFKRGIAKLKLDGVNKLKDTISVESNLIINLEDVENADSIIVTVSGFNGAILNKHESGLTQSVTIYASELSNFISGGIISVSAFNALPVTINNKNYLFGSCHQYSKLVYFKNPAL